MTLAIDGTASGSATSASSVTLSGLTTSNANDVIFVAVNAKNGSSAASAVSGVSGGGLTWAKRYASGSLALSSSNHQTLEVWYAIAASTLSSAAIAVSLASSAATIDVVAWGVSGANTATPFDTNSSLPKIATHNAGNSAPNVTGVSTTAANTMLFAVCTATGNSPGSTYATVVAAAPDNEYKVVSSSQSSVQVSFGSGDASTTWAILADAIQAIIPAGTGTAAGSATAAGSGVTAKGAAGTAAGAAAVAGAGRGVKMGTGTAAGLAVASGVGMQSGYAKGTASASSSATGVGRSLARATGTAAGSSVARGTPKAAGTGTAAGSSTATGHGVAASVGRGLAAGAATASGTTAATKKAHGTAAGAAAATGVGVKARAAAGTAAGSSTASGAGAYFTAPILNWFDTVISQYANSPILLGILSSFDAAEDPSGLFDAFYNNIWNIDTAQGIGLDIWGRIVGVPRTLQIQSGKFFGFDEATTASADPFNQSPFYGGGSTTSNYVLSDDAYRQLILAKAATNIWDGSIPSLNQILMDLFGASGNCYVRDNGDMTMDLVFTFPLSPVQAAIVGSGILPKPAGVSVGIVQP